MLESGATIAVVGASARAAAFSLLRAGYQVVAADLFADADLARQCPTLRVTDYPEIFTDWLAQTDCDAWLYTGGLENYPELIDRLATVRPLLGHVGESLRRVRDPLDLQTVLSDAGLHFPETKLVIAGQPSNGWLSKTYSGSGGSGVGLSNYGSEATVYWQRRVEGVPLSAVFVGERLLGVTRQLVGEAWAGADEFQYCGTITPWPIPTAYEQKLLQLGKLLCSEFGMTELYGVDLIDDGERLWTLEVNPRYTAAVEVVERAYGITAFDKIETPKLAPCCGKVVLFAKQTFVVSGELPEQLLRQTGEIAWPTLADIPVAGTEIAVGRPVLSLLAEGESCNAVEQRLRQRVAEIEVLLYAE